MEMRCALVATYNFATLTVCIVHHQDGKTHLQVVLAHDPLRKLTTNYLHHVNLVSILTLSHYVTHVTFTNFMSPCESSHELCCVH